MRLPRVGPSGMKCVAHGMSKATAGALDPKDVFDRAEGEGMGIHLAQAQPKKGCGPEEGFAKGRRWKDIHAQKEIANIAIQTQTCYLWIILEGQWSLKAAKGAKSGYAESG